MRLLTSSALILLAIHLQAAPTVCGPSDDLAATIKALRQAPRPAVLQLKSGRYPLAATLVLGPEDSGLTIEAAPGAQVQILGSVNVPNWAQTDPARNLWETTLVPPRKLRHLFINGQRLTLSRTPNTGWWETAEKLPKEGPFKMSIPQADFQTPWASDIWVIALQKWAGFRLTIQSVDPQNKTVTLPGHPVSHRQEIKNRFWIENSPDSLDLPGEWQLDSNTGKLRCIPPAGLSPDQAAVTTPHLNQLVRLEGCSEVVLRGLKFSECDEELPALGEIDVQAAAARRGAIRLIKAKQCRIESCEITKVGGYAIDLGAGSRANRIIGCQLHELGAGGVRIGELQPNGAIEVQVEANTVEDCEIAQYGQRYPGAVGLIIFQAARNQLLHNDIHDAPYSGISAGWTWGYKESPCRENLIEGNHIHHLGGPMMSDLGGVYLLGPQPGTIIRGNFIHDIARYEYGAWGLYTDEGSTGILLENNVVLRCQDSGFHQHYGKDNIVRNNLIAFCGEGGVRRTREENHLSFTFEKNLVINRTPEFLSSSFKNGNYRFSKNLYWCPMAEKSTWAHQSFEKWKAAGNDSDSLLTDPRFLDPEHPETGLQPDSPALALGFVMPNISTVGPRK